MKKAYSEGTLLMLDEVVGVIGCGKAISKDHKNEWMQRRFSLYPCGRVKVKGRKGSSLVWREADVQRAKALWSSQESVASSQKGEKKSPRADKSEEDMEHTILMTAKPDEKLDPLAELKAMEDQTADWLLSTGPRKVKTLMECSRSLLEIAMEELA